MMKKWYFGFILTALAFLVIVQQETVISNQEIVLEFTHSEITAVDVQDAVADIKSKLQDLGATNTRVTKGVRYGTLKISYYSEADVSCIKSFLSKAQKERLNHFVYNNSGEESEFPVQKEEKKYHLNVYEIQQSTDVKVDFNSLEVAELPLKQNRHSKSDSSHSFASRSTTSYLQTHHQVNGKIIIYATNAIALEATSHQIPQVRAGPFS